MKKSDLFNSDSICIFTDSSFKRENDISKPFYPGTTAPAYLVYNGDTCIEQGFHILHNSTSQQGELYAMLLGVMASYKYRYFKHIRLFSDNQNAVLSVREWIFNWVRDTSSGKAVLGDDGRISNQKYIMDIIYTIISNNLFLEFYHVKGHVDIRNYASVTNSKNLFLRSNPFVGTVDDSVIYQLAICNDAVDKYSTAMLIAHLNDGNYDTSTLVNAIEIGYTPFDMRNYITLVNKGGEHITF